MMILLSLLLIASFELAVVFVPKEYDLKDLKETISHEIGHIVEMEYPTNPEQIEANDELHEIKADHYMNFYLLVDKIVTDAVCALAGN
jgi:DNA replication initiation complex subunit (GINS family)